MKQFDLIVIGAGIAGIAVATQAVQAGLRVAVIDEHATVAQGGSFFHSGLILPSPLDPWFGPDVPLPTEGGVPWRRRARETAANAARLAQHLALAPLAAHAAQAVDALLQAAGSPAGMFDYERREGLLYLWRDKEAFARLPETLALLADSAAPPQQTSLLDAAACLAREPALEHGASLAGGVSFGGLASGNCAVVAKKLKQSLDVAGVTFMLARRVSQVQQDGALVNVSLQPAPSAAGAFSNVQARGFIAPSTEPIIGIDTRRTAPADAADRIRAPHVIIAAGAGSTRLLDSAGIVLPLRRVVRRALTGTVVREDCAPRTPLIDGDFGAAIVRYDRRVRASACISEGPLPVAAADLHASRRTRSLRDPVAPSGKRLDELVRQLHTWTDGLIPGAARYDTVPGNADALVGADGLPVIGPVRSAQHRAGGQIHLLLSGSYRGWGLAFAGAELVLRPITGERPGSDPGAFAPARFLR